MGIWHIEGRRLPRWLGALMHLAAQPAVHAGLPWLLSRAGERHGWSGGRPGPGNLAGLIPVLIGFGVIGWSLAVHVRAAPAGWRIEKTPHYPTPEYLVTRGPYRHSRNPIYLAEGAIWFGWILSYGSLVVLAALAAGCVIGPLVLKREERGLEARFGEAWRSYARSTPRWIQFPARDRETPHRSSASNSRP